MWLRNGERTVLVPDNMPDTIARCLRDGWVETTDPRTVVEPQPLPPEPAPIEPEPEPASEPAADPTAEPEPEPASEPEPAAKMKRG